MSVKIINNGGKISTTVKIIGSGQITLSPGSEIRDYSIIEMNNGILELGVNSVLGYFSFIQCTGTLKIGKGSLLGPRISYITSSHPINDKPLVGQPLIRGNITIGDNVWLGANITIGYDTIIGNNSIVGANSFVNKDIPTNEIWGGVPVKKLKDRI
jgi:acetyltransferase-like isoleucine patch superfamily enzyme